MSTATAPRLFDPDTDVLDAPPVRDVDNPIEYSIPGGMVRPIEDTGGLFYLEYFILWDGE